MAAELVEGVQTHPPTQAVQNLRLTLWNQNRFAGIAKKLVIGLSATTKLIYHINVS